MQVDVTSVNVVAAFCSSDEELEDSEVLQFLPIAPEVEDPEEGPTLPPPMPPNGSGSPPAKRPRYQAFEIALQGPPVDGKTIERLDTEEWLVINKHRTTVIMANCKSSVVGNFSYS